jgi:hypothetical protein
MICKKRSNSRAEDPKYLKELLLLFLSQVREQDALGLVEGLCCGRMKRVALRRQLGTDGSAVFRIVGPDDELVRFEPIDELRDIGTDARGMLGQRPQGERFSGFDKPSENLELRQRQPERLHRRFETLLDHVKRAHELDGQDLERLLIHDCNIQLRRIFVKERASASRAFLDFRFLFA